MAPPIVSRNPRTLETLAQHETTPIERLTEIWRRASAAQQKWAALPLRERCRFMLLVRETLLDQSNEIEAAIVAETGKPATEALLNEILPCAEQLTWLSRRAKAALRSRRLPLHLLKHRRSHIEYWPLGVVAVIAPWNYPLFLPFSTIVSALVAGNAVVFKPSEHATGVGLRIQGILDNSGLPADLIQTVVGDGTLGAAMIEHKPAKIFFTGSAETGRKIAQSAAQHLIPTQLELGGKNPMIILPDADLDFAASVALWGSFSNSGQMCASTDRILVHESVQAAFTERFLQKIGALRYSSDPASSDLGCITLEKQRSVYERQLADARERGLDVLAGGALSSDGRRLPPTVIAGAKVESSWAYRDETFGPIVTITPFRSTAEAVLKANDCRYGLAASIITRNLGLGEKLASQIEAGTVTLNDAACTAGLPEAPWGGLKDSGWGRSRSEEGLLEFVNARHIHRPRSRGLTFKAPWWFPYSPFQYSLGRHSLQLYRKHWLDKLRVVPLIAWNLAHFLKSERRL